MNILISFCSLLQLHFIRSYLAEHKTSSEATKDKTQLEEELILEANR